MHELLHEADAVEDGLGTRFILLPESDSGASDAAAMQAFLETVTSPRLRERPWTAIRGRGAFRRFKDVLTDSPSERERWAACTADRVRQHSLAWLVDEGFEPGAGTG
jgi:hypothetical protein